MIPAVTIFAGIVAAGASIFQMGETGPRLRLCLSGTFGAALIAVGISVLVVGAP